MFSFRLTSLLFRSELFRKAGFYPSRLVFLEEADFRELVGGFIRLSEELLRLFLFSVGEQLFEFFNRCLELLLAFQVSCAVPDVLPERFLS